MRTQIALEPEQHVQVKQKAASLGITMAEYIRRLVDRDLGRVDTNADVSAIVGIGSSGGSDIAAEGTVMAVAEAVATLRSRE
ncbi:hypothetical protein [Candidatus Poriferisodalis sp.]|uniref:hypothetical protein n=1 Tax=Candidatus Poriferisodalis sp. TaxID=3101277 RepID=UPI003AF58DBE